MYILCNHYPNEAIEIYIIPENSLLLVYSPPPLILFTSSYTRVRALVSSCAGRVSPPFRACHSQQNPCKCASRGCLTRSVGLRPTALRMAHEHTLSYKILEQYRQNKCPLGPLPFLLKLQLSVCVILPDLCIFIYIQVIWKKSRISLCP